MDESARRQSPIFSKSFDFLLWLLEHTEKFPKSERFRLAKRLEDSAFTFYESLIQSVHSKKRINLLFKADFELEKVRFYLRMAHRRKLSSTRQYHHAAGMLVEIGKLLGGWINSISED